MNAFSNLPIGSRTHTSSAAESCCQIAKCKNWRRSTGAADGSWRNQIPEMFRQPSHRMLVKQVHVALVEHASFDSSVLAILVEDTLHAPAENLAKAAHDSTGTVLFIN